MSYRHNFLVCLVVSLILTTIYRFYFSVAISVSPHVCFILVLILISVFLR